MRRIGVAVLTAAAFASAAAPAAAVEPQRLPPLELNQVTQGETDCGFLRWEVHLTVDRTNFFDSDGVRVRQVGHVQEDNLIINVTTGETFREGPDSFTQTIYFNPNGTISHFVANGIAVNVFGEQLKDVGRVIWLPGTNDVVFSAGMHSVREALDEGDVLSAFCVLFE